jgi:hypothetical protein
MYKFCFNDCIPKSNNKFSLTVCLEHTLREYNDVKTYYPDDVDGIITSTPISHLFLNEERFSLEHCVASIADKDLRTFAFRILSKHPIEKYFEEVDEDNLLQNGYTITIAGASHTAINPVIVSRNDGVLFTLGLHDDLRKNVLRITSNTTAIIDVHNLFGRDVNTTYIKDLIRKSITIKLCTFEQLLELIGAHSFSPRFVKGFKGSPAQVQISILQHFKIAIDRHGATKLYADGELIKDVTPKKFPHRVFELRIFRPVAYRVYFYEATKKTYLALIEKKPPQMKQDNHINAAASIIKQLIHLEP